MVRPRLSEEQALVSKENRRRTNAEYQRRSRAAARNAIADQRRLQENYLGPMNILCCHCGAAHISDVKVSNKGLSFNECCGHGSVILDETQSFPEPLKSMFKGTHEKSANFFQNIRYYNSSLAFASFIAKLFDFESRRPGPYCFKIHGTIYYQIYTSLYPDVNENPAFGQLFFVDPDEALEYRIGQNSHLDSEVLSVLDGLMREHNKFAQSYQMMKEELDHQRLLMNPNDEEPELQLLFTLKPGTDRRRYNFQRTNEVAAIFLTTADGEIPESYVTVREKRTKSLQCVSTLDPNVEAWVYPLFNSHGSFGWHKDLKWISTNSRDRGITRLDYTKYKIAIRSNAFNPLLYGRRLFQQ